MLSKKLFIGAAAMALTLSAATVAFGSGPQNGSLFQKVISINAENGFSFSSKDKNNLPEGVYYQDKISIDSKEGIPLK